MARKLFSAGLILLVSGLFIVNGIRGLITKSVEVRYGRFSRETHFLTDDSAMQYSWARLIFGCVILTVSGYKLLRNRF
ncbi:MAG: hypothetical protein WAO58_13275 [Fimbriimonadaceae bacterium]